MPSDCIPYRDTGYFSSLICDYLDEKDEIRSFYHRFPRPDNFKVQIEEKQQWFSKESRKVLVKALSHQYDGLDISTLTRQNIAALQQENTFTVTTGHQLNLFTGPLYFLYKILSTVNLCEQLSVQHPEHNFVPIYWMATEDHDFDEVNFFNFKGKKFQWNREAGGAVGEFSTDGLEDVLKLFAQEAGGGADAERLKTLFAEAYLQHEDLADATRYLANALFRDHGLVVVDGNDKELKRLFIPYVERELTEKVSYSEVSKTAQQLSSGSGKSYKVQVNPREINLFYLKEGLRERIIEEEGVFKVNNTGIEFSGAAIKEHLQEAPERFSPNVIMRPLYQEVVLPNLCYIGGGGELAYWLELKRCFDVFAVPFPMLLLRNSALLISEKRSEKLNRLTIPIRKLFLKRNDFINWHVRKISNINIDFAEQKKHLQEQFEAMHRLAGQTDKSFLGAVKAQEARQLKGLEHLEQRLLKAQKRRLKDQVARAVALQEQLFPRESLQERMMNFSEFYLEYGENLISVLKDELFPLDGGFKILTL